MTKKDFIERYTENAEIHSKAQGGKVLNKLLDLITDIVEEGHEIRLGGFGKFVVKETRAKTIGDIKGNGIRSIPAKTKVKFRPGEALKKSVASIK